MTGYAELTALKAAADQAAATVALLNARLNADRAALAGMRPTDPRWLLLNQQIIRLTQQITQASLVAGAARAGYVAALDALPEQLDPTVPCLLLPVRLETRIRPRTDGQAGDELICRIYPDDIHLDGHDPTLTDDEVVSGQHYWRQFWAAQGADDQPAQQRSAWTQLAGRVTPTRAAWVARQLTPTNLPPSAGVDPAFPVPVTRGPDGRSTVAQALPDRWVVRLWRDGLLLGEGRGELVARPLAVGPVTAPGETPGPAGWTTDLAAAFAAGMAVLVRPQPPVTLDRVDAVTATGVRGADSATDGGTTMRDLLDAHQYAPRVSFPGLDLVPPGTPTNNTPTTRSPYRSDPIGDRAALRQLGPRTAEHGDGSDADVLADALGLPDRDLDAAGSDERFPLGRLDNGGSPGQRDAAAMATLLWPATLGYYLRQFLAPVAGLPLGAELGDWRRFVVDTVRGRGPLPAVRVGDQPYGILPVLPISAWRHWPDRPELVVALWDAQQGAVLRIGWDLDASGGAGRWTGASGLVPVDPRTARLEIAAGYLDQQPTLVALTAPTGAGDIAYRLGSLAPDGAVQGWTAALPVLPAGAAAPLAATRAGVALATMDGAPAVVVAAEVYGQPVRQHLPSVSQPAGPLVADRGVGAVLAAEPEPPTVLIGPAGPVHPQVAPAPALRPPPGGGPGGGPLITVVCVGHGLSATGTVAGWSAAVAVPDSENAGELAAAATGDLTGTGATDLVLAYLRRGATGDEVAYRVGSGLSATGTASQWGGVSVLPLPTGWQAVDVSVTLTRLGGRPGPSLIVHVVGGPAGQVAGYYAIGEQLAAAGVSGGWIGWFTSDDASPAGSVLAAAVATLPLGTAPSIGLADPVGRVNLLERARSSWSGATGAVPRVGRVADPTDDLLDLFAGDVVASTVWGRGLIGPVLLANLWVASGYPIDVNQYATALWQATAPLPQAWGLLDPAAPDAADPHGKPRLGNSAFESVATQLAGDLTGDGVAAALLGLADAAPADLDKWQPAADAGLLERLAHHATMQAWADAGLALRPTGGPPDRAPDFEPELVDLNAVTGGETSGAHPFTWTAWRHLRTQTFPANHPWQGQHVEDGVARVLDIAEHGGDLTPYGVGGQRVRELAELRAALRHLATRPADALGWTLGETLDIATYRLDAWVTALATQRLRELRAAQPAGLHLGGYGVVLDLHKRTGPASEGYLHAPSAGQAVTAAVLHSAHLSHAGDANAAYPNAAKLSIDLTSRRVRDAIELADGVRAGQSLGALLGYRFERALLADPSLGLGQYLPALRQIAPMTAGKLSPVPTGASVDAVSGVDVVDGLALVRATEPDATSPIPWGSTPPGADFGLPAQTSPDGIRIAGAIGQLRDAVDALGDLLVAESVHQAVNGNPTASGGALDVLSGGEVPPPELSVIRTPRAGVGITHRILVALPDPGTVTELAAWTGGARQPRALAQPRLNAWSALALPDPGLVRWQAAWYDGAGAELDRAGYTLADAGLCPLDLVYLSGTQIASDTAVSMPEARAELVRMLACHAAATTPAPATGAALRIELARGAGWPDDALTVLELMEVATSVRNVVTGGRPATAAELSGPRGQRPEPDLDLTGVAAAATDARTALAAAVSALRKPFAGDPGALPGLLAAAYPDTPADVFTGLANLLDIPGHVDITAAVAATGPPAGTDADTIRAALLSLASYGVPHAAPVSPAGGDAADLVALAAQARQVATDAGTRLDAADAAIAAGTDPVAVLVALFGREFVVVPPFRAATGGQPPAPGGEFVAAGLPTPDGTLAAWLEGVAPVRAGAARLADLRLIAATATPDGSPATQLRVAQLPSSPAGWFGLPLPGAAPPPGGAVSMVLAGPPIDATQPVCALLLDDWVEVVPTGEQHTSVAFHVDAPGACAPQALLLAVAADPGRRWDHDALEQVVLDTVGLAQERAVDLDVAGAPAAGHYLPALLFASNDEHATVATAFPRVPPP